MKKKIVGLGELLWDMLPTGKQIGGAPGNFSFHAGQLGLDSTLVSAVGKDALGEELLAVANERGLQHIIIQIDKPTGTVDVKLDEQGIPQYTIVENVAWDFIPFTPELEQLATEADAVCFGSLAQRNAISRSTILHFLDVMKPGAMKVFDINLRQQFYSRDILQESMRRVNVLKLNDEEVSVVRDLFGYPEGTLLDTCVRLMEDYNLTSVILTCGTEGSYILNGSERSFMNTPKVQVADTVGAGDSFTAAYCAAVMQGKSIYEAHRLAVEVSAYVCTQNGAMPLLPKQQ